MGKSQTTLKTYDRVKVNKSSKILMLNKSPRDEAMTNSQPLSLSSMGREKENKGHTSRNHFTPRSNNLDATSPSTGLFHSQRINQFSTQFATSENTFNTRD